MPQKTLIHIGYPKTASTWLQTHFFNHPPLSFNSPFSAKEIKKKIVSAHSFQFNPSTIKKSFEERILTIPSDETLLISTESISRILINIREQRAMLRSSYKHYIKVLGTLSVEEWLNASAHNTKAKLPIFNPIRYGNLQNFTHNKLPTLHKLNYQKSFTTT